VIEKTSVLSQRGISWEKLQETADGVSLDLPEAARDCKLATDQDYSYGSFNDGRYFEEGRRATMDLSEAAPQIKLLADQGNSSVQFVRPSDLDGR
jgi:hypothetical protein